MVKEGFDEVNNRFNGVDNRFDRLESRVDKLESRVGRIESQLTTIVTKSYLDDKLADLKGDLITLIKKEDIKLTSLIDTLHHKEVLNKGETHKLLSLQPFPRTR